MLIDRCDFGAVENYYSNRLKGQPWVLGEFIQISYQLSDLRGENLGRGGREARGRKGKKKTDIECFGAQHSKTEVNEESGYPSGRWQGVFKCAIKIALREVSVPEQLQGRLRH